MADRPLHIAIDGRELFGKPTGVGRYLLEVSREWAQSPHRYSVVVPDEPTAPLRALGDRFQWVVETGAGAGTRWEQTRLPRALGRIRPDVFFAPANTAPLRLPCPFVVVVHDVSFCAHPEWFGRREGWRRRWLTHSAARRARTVVTVSKFSRQEIARYLRPPLEKIEVASPGAPAEQHLRAVDREPVVLYVGSLFNRRRIDDLMRGFAGMAAHVPAARLVLVGDNRTSPPIDPNERARTLGIADRFTWHSYVDDAEVSRLYASARVFAFLSDYEGFGIPPLEAIAHGVPVVLLDTAVTREVYGTGAVLVPPVISEISGALERLLSDPAAHASVLEAGRARLRAYSWSRTARVLLSALERAGFVTRSVDIIIVNYNTREDLAVCLASLTEAWPACAAQAIVVDNASTDGSVAMVKDRWPAVRTIALPQNAGFGAANNVALRQSQAPFVLLLNSDTIVPAGAIDALLARLEATRAAAAGPRLVDGNGRPEVSFGSMLTPWTEFTQRRRVRMASEGGPQAMQRINRLLASEQFVDWVSGACMLLRRADAEAAGLFDERYFMYEEDVDLCAAIRSRGGKVLFTPAVQVTHLRGRSVASATSTAGPTHYDRSHLAFYEKHAPGWAPWLRLWLRLRGRTIR